MRFFHCMASVNEDFLNSALIPLGLDSKYFEISPFSVILADMITFFCLFQEEAIVNSRGAIESESSKKS